MKLLPIRKKYAFCFSSHRLLPGCQNKMLPQSLARHASMKTFLADSYEKPYNDRLCLFRAIAFKEFGRDGLAASVQYLSSEILSEIWRQ